MDTACFPLSTAMIVGPGGRSPGFHALNKVTEILFLSDYSFIMPTNLLLSHQFFL
jgi:hypothetical protein